MSKASRGKIPNGREIGKIVTIVVSILTDSWATILETSDERIEVKWAGIRFGNKLRKRTARILDTDRFKKEDDCLVSGRATKASFGV